MVVMTEVKNGIGWIKINRPKVLNSINLEVVALMTEALEKWRNDSNIMFVCIHGEGEKGLCAGGDMRKFYDLKDEDVVSYAEDFFATEYHLDALIHHYAKPIVVYMNGIVMGGGVGLSVGASHRIVTERTKWAMPEMNIGFFPDVGASFFLNQLPGYVGRYLALTARVIKANDTIYIGAADYYMESSEWEAIQEKWLERKWSPDLIHQQLNAAIKSNSTSVIETSLLKNLQKEIDRHFQYETVEEIIESLHGEALKGDGWAAQEVLNLLSKSPTSLKVTLQQLINGIGKSLDECLEMEKNMAIHFMGTADFYEGVRAVLVDKDGSPNWVPSKLEDLDSSDIEKYFLIPVKN
ncbi:enoyl-CoA hydratase/isomerase family protein|uniref:enoyl-CoA hydratase/isomerase family protein n=1 Tax=Psychrobacter sp. D2 TaxID=2759702 RepID=UPI0015E61D40|nr:enoyl-CoA hydratase/isomerase family protein [Psychrobacter sp. D2]MBA2057857.1 enoyl-CoA hydratase/isomerase family protein [Psychrobacter sp. D2]